jgi:NADH-quinone oxidoreductase subunit J
MGLFDDVLAFFGGIWDKLCETGGFLLENPDALAFLILFAITAVSAIFVVISTEVVHSVFYLALTAVCVAMTYFFLEEEFVAIVQLLIYVGAVTIVFALSIMLTRTSIMAEKGGDGDEDR